MMKSLLKVSAAILIVGALMSWHIFVLTVLWGWFITPFGLPQLSIAWAFGIMLTVGALKFGNYEEPKPGHGWKKVGFFFVRPTFLLAIGWLLQPVGAVL